MYTIDLVISQEWFTHPLAYVVYCLAYFLIGIICSKIMTKRNIKKFNVCKNETISYISKREKEQNCGNRLILDNAISDRLRWERDREQAIEIIAFLTWLFWPAMLVVFFLSKIYLWIINGLD